MFSLKLPDQSGWKFPARSVGRDPSLSQFSLKFSLQLSLPTRRATSIHILGIEPQQRRLFTDATDQCGLSAAIRRIREIRAYFCPDVVCFELVSRAEKNLRHVFSASARSRWLDIFRLAALVA